MTLFTGGISLLALLLASHTSELRRESAESRREQREGQRRMRRSAELLWVYGSKDQNLATVYRSAGEGLFKDATRWQVHITPDTALTLEAIAERPAILIGTPSDNHLVSALSTRLPFEFGRQGFAIPDFFECEWSDVLVLANYPNPLNRSTPVYVITSMDGPALARSLTELPLQLRGTGQLKVLRKGVTRAYAFFESGEGNSWVLNRETSRIYPDSANLVTTRHFRFRYHGKADISERLGIISTKYEESLARLTSAFPSKFVSLDQNIPIEINLYEAAEDKGVMTGNTHVSHVDLPSEKVHVVCNDALDGTDFFSTAQLLIHKYIADSRSPALNDGLAMIFTKDWRKKGWEYWVKRIHEIGDAESLAEILDAENYGAESYLFMRPLAASLVGHLIEARGMDKFLELYHHWPETGVHTEFDLPAAQRDWYSYLSNMNKPDSNPDSNSIEGEAPHPVFQKGFCYAHEGYQITDGYISRGSRESLRKLKGLGTDWISITPFGYIRGNDKPSRFRFSFGPGSENDESVIQAAAYARSLGLGVMLKPHVWVGGADSPWPGEVKMKNKADWEQYFRRYYKWIRHYALLAEMADIDIFCIGTEMMYTTKAEHTERWREMIRKMKGLYDGAFVYAANWWLEYEHVEFWDEMDYVGLNCYAPLSEKDTVTVDELRQSMRGYFDTIESVVKKYKKPLLLTEIGFTSAEKPWQEPHKNDRRAPVDLQAQAACYEAIFQAFWQEDWFYGMYWWKWPSYLKDGGPDDSEFTPNSKPAEKVVKSWFSKGVPGDKPVRLAEVGTKR